VGYRMRILGVGWILIGIVGGVAVARELLWSLDVPTGSQPLDFVLPVSYFILAVLGGVFLVFRKVAGAAVLMILSVLWIIYIVRFYYVFQNTNIGSWVLIGIVATTLLPIATLVFGWQFAITFRGRP